MRECTTCGAQLPSHIAICPRCGSVQNAFTQGEQPIPQVGARTGGGPGMHNVGSAPDATTQPGTMPYGNMHYPQQAPTVRPPRPLYQGETPPQAPQRPLSKRRMALLLSLAILVMLFGFSLIFYTGVIRPTQLHTEATAAVQDAQTASAHTAQMQATATAQANAAASATAQARAQATATALQNLYTRITANTPVLSDTLAGPDAANWDVYNAQGGGGCAFTNGALYASVAQTHFYVPCFAQATNYSNFAFEAQMNIQKGDEGGLVFRADDAASKFYVFRISKDGAYSLFVSKDDKHSTPILDDTSSLIKTGTGQVNTLTVIAQDNTIYLYINKQFVSSAHDSSYTSGKIGIFAGDTNDTTDVAFSNVRVWTM